MQPTTQKRLRRTSARYLVGAPRDVVAVYDYGAGVLDRFTVLVQPNVLAWYHTRGQTFIGAFAMAEGGVGFSQCCEVQRGPHLGKLVRWRSLSHATRCHIKNRIEG
jgi:hypothetical protein